MLDPNTYTIERRSFLDYRPGPQPNGHATIEDWPDPLSDAAYYGLAGDVVRAFAPHTEADSVAILLQFLAAFGNAAGRGSYVRVEGNRHPPQIWPVLVGKSSKARKGTSWGRIRSLFAEAAPDWERERIVSGLSSGEGLIWNGRDPMTTSTKIRRPAFAWKSRPVPELPIRIYSFSNQSSHHRSAIWSGPGIFCRPRFGPSGTAARFRR